VNRVFVDAGPIVALLQPRDAHHLWATEAFDAIEPPLYTCESALSEASHLLGRVHGGPGAVLGLLARGVLQLGFRMDAELLALGTLMTRYASVPMSLADACLVRMTELEPRSTVLTIDSHFRIYRRAGRHTIPVIMPSPR
jgi:predicted nucleic acid-binding protein